MRWIFSIIIFIALPDLAEPGFSDELHRILLEKKATRFDLGVTQKGRAVEAYFFPGKSDRNALVIAGVHGSELSSIEVARVLVKQLSEGAELYYNVIVVPSLFPDNAKTACDHPLQIGSIHNIGRYSYAGAADPNRQLPTPGFGLDNDDCRDHAGRPIEMENKWLLKLIRDFRPSRIASIHAIRDTRYAGFFADPRTDAKGFALGYDSDSSLAVEMSLHALTIGSSIRGNLVDGKLNAVYCKDPMPVQRGQFQKRNMKGSPMPGHGSAGVSLGTWGTTAVNDSSDAGNDREAMRVITIEFPGSKRPRDYVGERRLVCEREVEAYASAIRNVFLQERYLE